MSLFKELRELEEQGIDLIEVLGQDRHLRSPDDLQAILRLLDRPGEDLYTELLYLLTHRRFSPAQAAAIWGAVIRHKKQMAERLGRPVAFRVAALDFLTGKNPQLRGARLIGREEMEALLGHINIDEVTAVYTRRYFNERLIAEVSRARRYGSALSLLVIDLDDFKRVNDQEGHPAGDSLLRRVGRLLTQSTRQSDAVCRYGGDEFAVILPETSGSEAYTLAERIRAAAPLVASGDGTGQPAAGGGSGSARGGPARAAIGFSIGGATFPVDCEEAQELVEIADRQCLLAKREGKNAVRMSGDRRGEEAGGPGNSVDPHPPS
jgi:GGDEF domain-containing protein